MVHSFYRCGRKFTFDVHVTGMFCHSNWNTDPIIVLKRHEKEKKDKYPDICLERRMDFCPLIYSVDRIPGRDVKAAEKQLAETLSEKWNRLYSQMVYYVRVRMLAAVVRSNSLLICGSCERCFIPRPFIETGAAMHNWQY